MAREGREESFDSNSCRTTHSRLILSGILVSLIFLHSPSPFSSIDPSNSAHVCHLALAQKGSRAKRACGTSVVGKGLLFKWFGEEPATKMGPTFSHRWARCFFCFLCCVHSPPPPPHLLKISILFVPSPNPNHTASRRYVMSPYSTRFATLSG